MELTEPIESINNQLRDLFGIDTVTGREMFRVVWANDQYEKRLTEYTDSGILLLVPEVRELPKYPWAKDRYMLENLVIVPDVSRQELAGLKLSYEPIWKFENAQEEAVPPTVWACKFIIDCYQAALGKKSLAKYVDPDKDNPIEEKEKRVNKLQEELFGDESGLLGRTITGETIVVPHNEFKES